MLPDESVESTGTSPESAEISSAEAATAGSEETEVSETEEQTEQEETKRKEGMAKRIGTLAFRLREAERKGRELETKNIDLQEKLKEKPETIDPDAGAPKPEDFDNDRDYLRAASKHDLKVMLAQSKAEDVRDVQTTQAKKDAIESQKVFVDKIESGFDEYGDRFEEAVQDVNYSPLMVKHIGTSDKMPQIAMYLLDNPQEAKDMRAMSEAQLVRAIVMLEHNITSAKTPSKQRTEAPPPPTGVKSSKSISGSTDFKKISGDQYLKKMNKERVDKARAERL